MSSPLTPKTLSPADAAEASPIDAPMPGWVAPLHADDGFDIGAGDPFSVLLAETWVRTDEGTVFERHVRRLNTIAGVREHAAIVVEFDPASESLAWHGVTVRRDGRTIHTASAGETSVVPVDPEAARRGEACPVRVEAAWHDLEPGDVIEASFSRLPREGDGASAPFAARIDLQGARPVGTARVVVESAPDAPARFQVDPAPIAPAEEAGGDGRLRLVWRLDHVPPVVDEPGTPPWFRPAVSVLVTTFPDWGAVAGWLVERWKPSLVLTDAVAARAAAIAGPSEDPVEVRILRLVDHVQQRLVHVPGPANAMRMIPRPPDEVLERGRGNSLDLAFLLTVLLHAVEVPSRPLLVPRAGNPRLRQELPSPTSLDHAIVQIRLDRTLHTIDPTAEGQRGPLERRSLAGFDFGLPLSADAKDVVTLEPRTPGRLLLREYFRLAPRNRNSSLEVTFKASGGQADQLRHRAAVEGLTRVGESFAEAFLREYTGVQRPDPLEIDDDEQRDVVTWKQAFGIAEFGTRSEDGSSVRFACSAHAIRDHLVTPGAGERRTPLALPWPFDHVEEIVVEAPGAKNVEADAREVDSPFFRYTRAIQRVPQGLRIIHQWVSKAAQVPPDSIGDYRKDLETVTALLDFIVDVPLLRGFPFRHKQAAGSLLGSEDHAAPAVPGSPQPDSGPSSSSQATGARVPVKSALAARKSGNIAALKVTGRPQANDLTIDELDSIFERDEREGEAAAAAIMQGEDVRDAGAAAPRRRRPSRDEDDIAAFDATGLTTERARLPGRRHANATGETGRRVLNIFGILGALAVVGILGAVFSGAFDPKPNDTAPIEAVRTSLDDPAFVAARRSLRAGELDAARSQLEALSARFGDQPDFLVARAELLAADGDLQGAADSVSEAIRLAPGHVDAYQAAAAIERRAGNLQAAAAALGRAVNLAPDDDDAWRRLAVVLREGGQVQGAEEAVLRANALEPDKLDNIVELARLRFIQQSPLLARKVFEDAIGRREEGKQDAGLHLAFSRFLLETEQTADAVLQAEKALGIDTFNPAVLRAVASIYETAGRKESATRLLHQAEGLERRGGRSSPENPPPPVTSDELPTPPPVTSDSADAGP